MEIKSHVNVFRKEFLLKPIPIIEYTQTENWQSNFPAEYTIYIQEHDDIYPVRYITTNKDFVELLYKNKLENDKIIPKNWNDYIYPYLFDIVEVKQFEYFKLFNEPWKSVF